jgi:hypothetical protein
MIGGYKKVLYAFPVQLLLIQIKRNPALISVWFLLIALFTGGFGKIYGVPYLFLDPEYLNRVNGLSFFILGLTFGCFVMSYHITCYILDSHRFPFIGILEKPFAKFCINNSLLPVITLIVFLVFTIRFHINSEFTSYQQLALNVIGFLAGISSMIMFFYFYFKWTNKDIFKFLSGSVDKRLMKSGISRDRVLARYKESRKSKYMVWSYFDLKLRIRPSAHLDDFYDKKALLKVFDQNHLNSVLLEFGIIAIVFLLGSFMDYPHFQIPAGSSALLMMSILVMFIGAVSYWFKAWGFAFVLGLVLFVNFLMKMGVLNGSYEVRGLEYFGSKATYSLKQIRENNSPDVVKADFEKGVLMLEKWKQKQVSEKPRMIFLCVSGGGQRAALWTVNALQKANEVLDGTLMDKTVMITGASGGMIGAAYFREVNHTNAKSMHTNEEQLVNMGKDNLNAIIYTLMVNDAFFRVREVEYGTRKHTKDRGYIFEENLNRNLGSVFRMRMSDYREDELEAKIPLLLLSPVVANDGRKMYISNLPMSYINVGMSSLNDDEEDLQDVFGVDFYRLFQDQGAEDLNFLSALRMSASFPYITPTINLPSEPQIEIMDAGIADNFGVSDAVRFIGVYEDWIKENTSGVVLLVIRDTRKYSPIEPQSSQSLFDRLTYPVSSVYNNLANIQDINNDSKIDELRRNFILPFDVIDFEYNTYSGINTDYLIEANEIERKRVERAALSWHLTTKEKQNIIENINNPDNQRSLERLRKVMVE